MSERITITIETGNAAFLNYRGIEIGRILHATADEFEKYGDCQNHPRDINGNRCGSVKVEPMED